MKPTIGVPHKALHDSWQEVLDSGQFTEGKYVKLFEEAVGNFYGQEAIAYSNCGTGLFSILRQYEEMMVLVPTNTFAATMSMTYEAGHDVALVDASARDLSISIDTVADAHQLLLNAKEDAEAILLTHVGGWRALDYEAVADYADAMKLSLFEDGAHVLGVAGIGLRGIATSFSLYPTKALPAGDGGVVITQDPVLAERLRQFRNYGKYVEDGVIRYKAGFNFRMDEWTAVVAYHQFLRVAEIMERREAAADRLRAVVKPLYEGPGSNWYKYVAPSDYPATRQAGKVYALSDQMTTLGGVPPMPNAAKIAQNHICLPIWEDAYAGMTVGQIEKYLQGGDYEGSPV